MDEAQQNGHGQHVTQSSQNFEMSVHPLFSLSKLHSQVHTLRVFYIAYLSLKADPGGRAA